MHSGRCAAALRYLLLGAAVCSAAAAARATDVTWTTSGGGSFQDEANWVPDLPFSSDVPGVNDVAHFGLTTSSVGAPVTYTVTFAADATNQRLVVEDDRVTFDLNGHTYTATSPIAVVLGTVSGRLGRVAVMDGLLSTPLQADIEIGSVAGSSGTLQVLTDGLVLGSPEIFVGVDGGGTLSIFNGGDVIADAVTLGKNAGSTGTATITGASSSLTAVGLTVGGMGAGTLNVTDGGKVDCAADLNVGGLGMGTLNVQFGSEVDADKVTFGVNAGSDGTATITGAGSRLDARELVVGRNANGTLNINAGGQVNNSDAIVGGELSDATSGSGIVNVDGNGSTWDVADILVVGLQGNGTLNITAGGRVQCRTAVVGERRGLASHVIVSSADPAADSVWAADGNIFIGDLEVPGTLIIGNGGVVSVGGTMAVDVNGRVDLQGGVLNATSLVSRATSSLIFPEFSWVGAGTLRVGTFEGDLLVPNAGVLEPVRSLTGTTIQGDYRQLTNGTLALEIGGPVRFTDYAVLHSEGSADVSGVLQISLSDGFVPTGINAFYILEADGGFTGSFANVANGQRLTTTDGLGSFLVSYGAGSPFNPNQVVLTNFLQSSALLGDYNQNGIVDAADYTVWRNNLGSSTALPNDDTPGVGPDDYTRWKTHFGQSAGSGAVLAAIPEPAAMALLAAGICCAGVICTAPRRESRIAVGSANA